MGSWRRLRGYIGGLPRPATLNDLVDLLSKTVFALAAALTALLVGCYNDHQSAIASAQNKIAEEAKANRERSEGVRQTVALFVAFTPKDTSDWQYSMKLNALSAYCTTVQLHKSQTAAEQATDGWWMRLLRRIGLRSPAPASAPKPAAEKQEDIDQNGQFDSPVDQVFCKNNGALGERLQTTSGPATTAAVKAVAKTGNVQAYTNSNAAAAQAAVLAAGESSGSIAPNEAWYAVAASLPVAQAAAVPALVRALDWKLSTIVVDPRDNVHVYCTRISGSIALTSGATKSQADAAERARLLRASGVVSDAFSQPDRDWVPVSADQAGACPTLTTPIKSGPAG